MTSLLLLEDIVKSYGRLSRKRVLDGVCLALPEGGILGLVGETGHGKTSLARIITGLEQPDSGRVIFKGRQLPEIRRREFNDCAAIQYVFQDPYAALDGDQSVEQVLAEAARLCLRHRRFDIVPPRDCLRFVGLVEPEQWLKHKVGSLSGGQRQKVVLARALLPRPELLIADESTSMLDMASGLEIAGLFQKINQTWGTAIMVISHQLDIINRACAEIAVMREGRVIGQGALERLLTGNGNPYVRELLEAMQIFSGGDIYEPNSQS